MRPLLVLKFLNYNTSIALLFESWRIYDFRTCWVGQNMIFCCYVQYIYLICKLSFQWNLLSVKWNSLVFHHELLVKKEKQKSSRLLCSQTFEWFSTSAKPSAKMMKGNTHPAISLPKVFLYLIIPLTSRGLYHGSLHLWLICKVMIFEQEPRKIGFQLL